MTFHHPSINQFFGFTKHNVIPFVCIDNPLVYVQKQNAWDTSKLFGLFKRFENAAEALKTFFEALQKFPTILTKEFAELYEAKSAAEAEILDA